MNLVFALTEHHVHRTLTLLMTPCRAPNDSFRGDNESLCGSIARHPDRGGTDTWAHAKKKNNTQLWLGLTQINTARAKQISRNTCAFKPRARQIQTSHQPTSSPTSFRRSLVNKSVHVHPRCLSWQRWGCGIVLPVAVIFDSRDVFLHRNRTHEREAASWSSPPLPPSFQQCRTNVPS